MPARTRIAASVVAAVAVAVAALGVLASSASPPTLATARATSDTTATTSAPTSGPTTSPPPTTAVATTLPPPPTTTTPPPPVATADGAVLLVWISGGLPDGFADEVQSLPQVVASTVVAGDLLALVESVAASGEIVDRPSSGWAIPIDAFAVDPAGYARFQPAADARVLAALEPGGAVLSRTSAALRRVGVGAVLRFATGSVTVSGIVDDASVGGAEVVVHRADMARLGIDDDRFVLLVDRDRAGVERAVRARTPPDAHLSLRSSAEAAWLRHGDRVQPQALVKAAFGEFAFRDRSGRDIEIDPAWVRAHIVTETVPILGPITCHRAALPAVRAAMDELEASGRADTVDPSAYAGCHYARRIAPGAGLSRHSWGIALDLNIRGNPRGTYESQDAALVHAMTARGFDWGGEWEFPDPGHYELRAPG